MRIQDSALVAAATLSNRYIADRFLPDKAIDLIDEAASRLRIEIDSMPTEVDDVRRKIIQLEIEREALRKETDPLSKGRLAEIEKEMAELNEKFTAPQGPLGAGEGRHRGHPRRSRSKIEKTQGEMADGRAHRPTWTGPPS